MSEKLERVGEIVSGHMNDIADCFKPECKIAVIVRTPGNDEADFLMTNDDLSEVAKLIDRRTSPPTDETEN